MSKEVEIQNIVSSYNDLELSELLDRATAEIKFRDKKRRYEIDHIPDSVLFNLNNRYKSLYGTNKITVTLSLDVDIDIETDGSIDIVLSDTGYDAPKSAYLDSKVRDLVAKIQEQRHVFENDIDEIAGNYDVLSNNIRNWIRCSS